MRVFFCSCSPDLTGYFQSDTGSISSAPSTLFSQFMTHMCPFLELSISTFFSGSGHLVSCLMGSTSLTRLLGLGVCSDMDLRRVRTAKIFWRLEVHGQGASRLGLW